MRGESYTLAAMAEQTTTDTSAAATSAAAVSEAARSRPRLSGRLAALAPSAAGLVLGLLALGPGIGPGYLLSYDMVFVPRPQFTSALLGTSGVLPRAVPSDAVVAALARALPADVVQKLILLAIIVLACAGAARLLSAERLPAQLAAGVLYAWNPYVAERLILGQWALLLGYAGLPWVLAAATRPAVRAGKRAVSLTAALVPAAVGGFAAMSISALIAGPAAILHRGTVRTRLQLTAATAVILAVLSLPWLIPSLTRHVLTSPAGVAAFAARADTPFGTPGSLILLGGAWNAQTVPAGYGGAGAVPWLLLAGTALAGFLLLGRGRWPGLGAGAAAGLLLALPGTNGPGRDLLRALITAWPGFAVLRDGQQFIAPLALAEAVGFGLVVAAALRIRRPAALAECRALVAASLALVPVLFLPGLAWGAAGRLQPVQYPADWLAARQLINSDPRPGAALLLPWGAYRRFGWNHDEALLDPWPRLLARDVVYNDGVQVGSLQIPPEDPRAIAISAAVTSAAPLTPVLRADGYRYVIVDAGFASPPSGGGPARPVQLPFRSRLAGCRVVFAGPGLDVYLVPG